MIQRILQRLDPLLTRRRVIWFAIAIGLLLSIPALLVPRGLDDNTHRVMFDGTIDLLERAPTDYFNFMPDDPAWHAEALETGALAWFASDDTHVRFMRPVSSLTLHLDFLLWPDSAVMAHVQSFLWFACLVFVVGLFYRRVLPSPFAAGFATLLTAMDDAHGFTIGWIANRNALVAMTFAFLCLVLHDRWRRDGSIKAGMAAPIVLAIALLSGEMALSATAYLFAYMVWLDPGDRKTKVLSLVPYALVAGVWLGVYKMLGYGTGGSGIYLDPLGQPVAFLSAVWHRFSTLWLGAISPIPADAGAMLTALTIPIAIIGWALVVAFVALARRYANSRSTWFLLTGAALSTVPLCAAFPSDRVLVPVSVGVIGVVALIVDGARKTKSATGSDDVRDTSSGAHHSNETSTATPPNFALPVVVSVLVGVHLLIPLLMRPAKSYLFEPLASVYNACSFSFDALETPLSGQTVVIVSAPDNFGGAYSLFMRPAFGLDSPHRAITLATGLSGGTVERESSTTLRISANESFTTEAFDALMRSPNDPYTIGELTTLSDASIEVTALSEGLPCQILVTFNQPLESLGYIWAEWSLDGYVAFVLPEVGATREMAAYTAGDFMSFRYPDPRGL